MSGSDEALEASSSAPMLPSRAQVTYHTAGSSWRRYALELSVALVGRPLINIIAAGNRAMIKSRVHTGNRSSLRAMAR